MISIIFTGTSDLNGQTNRAVRKLLLQHRVPLPVCFQARFFYSVRLDQAVQISAISPNSFKVVEVDPPLGQVADHGIPPRWQLHSKAGSGRTEEFDSPMNRLCQVQAITGG